MANHSSNRLSSPSNGALASWPVRLLLGLLLASFAVCLWIGIRAALARPVRSGLTSPQATAGLAGAPQETPAATAVPLLNPVGAPSPAALPTSANPGPRPSATVLFTPAATRPVTLNPAPAASNPAGARHTYTIQPGDSLPQIAARYHLEPLALMQANHIGNPLTIAAGQVLVIPPASSESRRVVVDLSEQRLYSYEDEALVYTFRVSTGQNNGTLRGSFSVLDKIENAYSEMWGVWMPYWMGIYYAAGSVENGLHALPLNKNGQRLYTGSLGQPVSAGCVMLAPEDAQMLYDWVVVGTPVLIRD